jgi:2-polyprenyl-3-methyl-5-hydroxy-6-metoxy-1,4-benzoquinol methylase
MQDSPIPRPPDGVDMTKPGSGGWISAQEVSRVVSAIYPSGPSLVQLAQRHRYRIAPVHRVLAEVPAASSVLDIGCGGELFLNCLAALGRIRSGHGFDASPTAIRVARAAAARLGGSGSRVLPSFDVRRAEQGLPEGTFDVVLLADVLHHVPEAARQRLFLAAASRLAVGGVLVIKEMGADPAWRACANRVHDLVLARQWVSHLPRGTMDGWARAAALELTVSERIHMLWYSHDLAVYRSRGRTLD